MPVSNKKLIQIVIINVYVAYKLYRVHNDIKPIDFIKMFKSSTSETMDSIVKNDSDTLDFEEFKLACCEVD